ncbi:MAG: acyl carrier protein phosphodiesterase [Leadbetterella sp.]|nr:acyl carrier protein phosphodiesterase [Leadbetterella sp.]
MPADVKTGLRLHRHIDTFTDSDKEMGACKQLFYPGFGKYSPVVVDVILDHFLHKNWEVFAEEEFDVFKNRVYRSLTTCYTEWQPPALQALVRSMVQHDWLKDYIHFSGVEKALSSLNRRVRQVDLTGAVPVMKQHYDEIDHLFLGFFKRLKTSCDTEFSEHGQ